MIFMLFKMKNVSDNTKIIQILIINYYYLLIPYIDTLPLIMTLHYSLVYLVLRPVKNTSCQKNSNNYNN